MNSKVQEAFSKFSYFRILWHTIKDITEVYNWPAFKICKQLSPGLSDVWPNPPVTNGDQELPSQGSKAFWEVL